jgi:hypothetical protein
MKLALVLVVLFWSGLAMADGSNHWTVAVQGADQPYMCNECDLATRIPDATAAQALNTWQVSHSPFVGQVDRNGVYRPCRTATRSVCATKRAVQPTPVSRRRGQTAPLVEH